MPLFCSLRAHGPGYSFQASHLYFHGVLLFLFPSPQHTASSGSEPHIMPWEPVCNNRLELGFTKSLMPTSFLPCFLNQGHKLLGEQQSSRIFASMPSSALLTPCKYGSPNPPGHISSCTTRRWSFPHPPRSHTDLSIQLKHLGILFPVPQIPQCSFPFHSWSSFQGSTFSRYTSLLLSHGTDWDHPWPNKSQWFSHLLCFPPLCSHFCHLIPLYAHLPVLIPIHVTHLRRWQRMSNVFIIPLSHICRSSRQLSSLCSF